MTIYAELDANSIVVNTIVADADFVATQTDKTYVLCTSAGIGYSYDAVANVFVAPKPFASWTLDNNHNWQPPTAKPDGNYAWNELELKWIELA